MVKKNFDILKDKIANSKQSNATSILDRAEKIAGSIPSPLSKGIPHSPSMTDTFTRESGPPNEQSVELEKPEAFTRESSDNKNEDVVPAKTDAFTRESAGGRKEPYFKRVPYELIKPNPFNARQTYLSQKVNKMAVEISADGQLTPGVATIRDGKYVLAAGHYRWKGIGVAKIGFMDLMIHEGLTDQELYKLSFKENDQRHGQSALDNALAWKLLLDEKLYENETQISEVTGLSLPTINKTMLILNLPEKVLNYIKEQDVNNFGLSPLYELTQYSQVATPQATYDMAEKIITEGYGRDQIAAARKLLQAPKVRKQKEMASNYKLPNNGFIKEFGSGKVVFEANITDPEVRKQLIEELKTRFQ